MNRKLLTATSAAALALAAPSPAGADGLPGGGNANPGGITMPGLGTNFILVPAGRGSTLGRIDRRTGRLENSTYLRSGFAMPAVAFDGTPGGLSAGGGTLVLIRPRVKFPQTSTTLAIVDGKRLRIRRTLRLRGDFSFDAISPDGRTLYLIEYRSKSDTTKYAVRSYDVTHERLVPGAIVDSREPDEKMTGYPVTRAASAHGRWAYTLYNGAEHPFVHALDTVHRRAFCVDLAALSTDDLVNAHLDLSADGRTLAVRRRGTPLALIDTHTFRVSSPGAAAAPRGQRDGAPWAVLGIVAAALLLAGGAAGVNARRSRPAWENRS
jgi:hypothetical protein